MTETKKKISLTRKILYGVGTGGGNVFSQIGAAFLLSYYTDTALMGAAAIGTMFVVCRIFDGVSDLAMGALVDKTKTRWGKARPWLIASGPLTVVGIILLMHVPAGASDGGKLVYAYITYIFMSVIVYTIFGIANTAMLPLMTRDPKDSTMLATFSAVGNNVIGLIAGSAITPLVLAFGWHTASIFLGLISGVLILISGLVNKEDAALPAEVGEEAVEERPTLKQQFPSVLRNRYFWLLLLIGVFSLLMNANAIAAQAYFASAVMGNAMYMSLLITAGQAPGIVILFLMPVISNKWSKQVFLTIGAVLLIIGFVICGLGSSNLVVVVIGVIIRSLGAGPLLSAVFALVPDCVEYGYWKFGVRSEGLISSAQSIGSKIGMGFGSGMCAYILAAVGYDATLEVQAASVVNAIKFTYTYLGAIIGVVILVLVLLTNVEKFAPQYREANALKDREKEEARAKAKAEAQAQA